MFYLFYETSSNIIFSHLFSAVDFYAAQLIVKQLLCNYRKLVNSNITQKEKIKVNLRTVNLKSLLLFLLLDAGISPRADLGGGCRGCAPPPPEVTRGFLIQLVFCRKKITMWFIGVEVEQEKSAPPPKKNPGSAPDPYSVDFLRSTHSQTKR